MKSLHQTDLKMKNIGLTGFDNEKPNLNTREIIVRWADCGSSELGLLLWSTIPC